MTKNNPLMDEEFLLDLESYHSREVYARITSLTFDEEVIEAIEGKVSSGSINIDGTSSVRRTCSLSLIAQDVNIDEFYWGMNTKFKLETGLKNMINPDYPDIIWFNQGVYLITSFSANLQNNSYTISIQGKDKMSLLNGDVGGALPHQVDFGEEDLYDADGNLTKVKIPLKRIIKEAVHQYGKELWHNIIVNDLDNKGVELLEYRGTRPLYFLISKYGDGTNDVYQMTSNGDIACFKVSEDGIKSATTLKQLKYTSRSNLMEDDYDIICFDTTSGLEFGVMKVEYGETVGYRETELTYAGDLIGGVGESLTSVLDKIVSMLGSYEYFYDVDGHFIFQQKENYLSNNWNNIINDEEEFINTAEYSSPSIFDFRGSKLIISYANNPNLLNLKNDYSIWGVRKTVSGSEIPIHIRYAICDKPTYYKNYNGEIFSSRDIEWREILYQMAQDYLQHNHEDDFLWNIAKNNTIEKTNENGIRYSESLYPYGITGYEPFYIEFNSYGYWRELYDPNSTNEKLDSNSEPTKDAYYYKWDGENYQQIVAADVRVLKDITDVTEDLYKLENNAYIKINKLVDDWYTVEFVYDEITNTVSQIKKIKTNKLFYYFDGEEYILYNPYKWIIPPTDDNPYYLNNVFAVEGKHKYWNKEVVNNPSLINFWFDLIDDGELMKYSVKTIGDRLMAINKNDIGAIYFKETPKVIFSGEKGE